MELVHRGTHRIFNIIGYILIFILGLHIGHRFSSVDIFRIYKFQYVTVPLDANKSSMNISNKGRFYDIGMKYQTDKTTSHHYEAIYEKYLSKYIKSNLSLLEIGLGCQMPYGPGASAYLWRDYFGSQANIHFIEYDQSCGQIWYNSHGEKLNIKMHYGSQDDIEFLNTINNDYFDVIIDDGGHSMNQQITSFTYLFPKLRSGGVYFIEDLQTSYFPSVDSGYLVNSTTIEFIKRLIDDIQVNSPRKLTQLGEKIFSFEISNKICVFNKK